MIKRRFTVLTLSLFLLVMNAIIAFVLIPKTDALSDQCGDLPLRLIPGDYGIVTPGSPNNLRSGPGKDRNIIGEIPGGAQFYVVSDASCHDGLAWFYVNFDGTYGFTAEGSGSTYYTEPVPPQVVSTVDGNLTQVIDGGVQFGFEDLLAEYVTVTTVPALTDAELTPMEASSRAYQYPDYRQYRFQDYMLDDAAFTPEFNIYPAQEYMRVNRYAEEGATALNGLRDGSVKLDDALVTLARPWEYASGIFDHAVGQGMLLEFQGGFGVRYVVRWVSDIDYVTETIYAFYGITDDQQHYITAFFPVTVAELPDVQFPQTMDSADEVDADIAQAAEVLNGETIELTPGFWRMDTLAQSIVIS